MCRTKSRSLLERLIVILLAVVVVMTYMPVDAFAGSWRTGDYAYFRNGSNLIGKDGKTYLGSYSPTPRHAYCIAPTGGGKTVRAYCIQRMVMNPSNGNTKYKAHNWSAVSHLSSLSVNTQEAIQVALLYGKQSDSTLSDMEELLGVSRNDANLDDWYLATQLIIWDFEIGHRKSLQSIPENVGRSHLGLVSAGGEPYDINYDAIKGRPAEKVYFAMLKAMRKHKIRPFFTGKNEKTAKTINMVKYTNAAGKTVFRSVSPAFAKRLKAAPTVADFDLLLANATDADFTLTDTNNLNSDLKVMKNGNKDSAYKFIKKGNSKYILEYSGTTLPTTAKKEGKKNIPETTSDDLLAWSASGYQVVTTGADDPVSFYFKMTQIKATDKPAGEVSHPERPEIEVYPELSFPVHKDDLNSGWDGDNCTGMGDASLGSTFELYREGELVDTITLDDYGSTDVLTDIPWSEGDIQAVESGSYDHMTGNPGSEVLHCTVTPTKATWDAEVNYTIKEIPPAGRHTEAASGTGTGERTYKVKYHAESSNSQTCIYDQNGKWSDIKYTITYTNADGSVTKDEGTVEAGEIESVLEHEYDEAVFVNDNYRGEVQVVKTINDQDPFTENESGVKTYSKNSKWTLRLQSGGFEGNPYVKVVDEGTASSGYGRFAHKYRVTRNASGTPADENNPLTVSTDGQIHIYDLPYGTYILEEVSADKNGYVLESCTFTISADGQAVTKDFNNQAKKNIIKVTKTNSETGKTVRWDAERTAFRIRYKGNPDLADPTTATNYNRYLPNGSSYTDDRAYVFYANKNGEIVLPYQIEYGIYEIEELVVPKGYYVGSYDANGTGSIADMGEVNIINHEGQSVRPPKSYLETVQVRDANGNKIEEFTGGSDTTYNKYRFTVLEQDPHEDGKDYVKYYAVLEMPNNPAKGKLEIVKNGEALAGWSIGDIWSAIWDKIRQKDTTYEIYAADDIMLSDGVIPVKAYKSSDNEEIKLTEVSRDHSDVSAGAKQIWEKILNNVKITKTSQKDASANNKTVTDYTVNAQNGATYSNTFTVRDEDKKMTYKYTVKYALNATSGFNYTDVHVTKESISDDYVASIAITKPTLLNGEGSDAEIGFVTMNYANGNMVRMNRIAGEENVAEFDVTGFHSDYNTDDITASIAAPVEPEPVMIQNPANPNDPTDLIQKVDEHGNPVFTVPAAVIRPAGWTDVVDSNGKKTYEDRVDENGNPLPKYYMVTKNDEYMILIKEGGNERWIPCDKDCNFYKSYTQEYYFTTAQHYNCDDGFKFTWDDNIELIAKADHAADNAVTKIKKAPNGNVLITEVDGAYTHEEVGNYTVFTGVAGEKAPVYFVTNDGIRTEMYLSGGLTHTTITVTDSQLFKFDKLLPMVTYNGEEIKWSENFFPYTADTFEKIYDDRNFIKATRYEVSGTNPETYYTIEITSNNSDVTKGFKITYPDTTTAIPVVTDETSAKLTFESTDDTLVYPVGSPVETITTNIKGIAESSALPLGDYWVREVSSNAGHVNKGQWRKMSVAYEDQYTPLVWDSETFENDAVSVRIDLDKLFETAYESKQYESGSGAVFGIYTAEAITGTADTTLPYDERTIPKDTLVGKMVVDNGHATTTIKLPQGKYYVKEISAPSGFKLNGTKYYFDAVDVLTADQMSWHYTDIGVTGFITQNGENGLTVDFDTLYRYNAANVNIDGRDFMMNQSFNDADSNVSVAVMDGRTNTQVTLKDGESTVIKFENGAVMKITAEGQTYTAVLDGPAPAALSTGAPGNENFTTSTSGTKTIIKYSPKVTKTNWLSEVTYKYQAPTETSPVVDKKIALASPEATSEVTASVDYDYAEADLTWTAGTVTGVTLDDVALGAAEYASGIKMVHIIKTPVMIQNPANPSDPTDLIQKVDEHGNPVFDITVKGTKAVINFDDGTSYTVTFDRSGQFSISASGEANRKLSAESTLKVDDLPVTENALNSASLITFKNTESKTYARNNTNAGVLNITINKVKNDRVQTYHDPVIPSPGPSPAIKTAAKDSDTGEHISKPDSDVTIIDTVSYNNLTAGKEYVLKGVLMDKVTGKTVLIDGKEVTAEMKFTPEKESGMVEMSFTFDASSLSGKTVVVFESLELDSSEVAKHKDINDAAQTIYFPEVKTTAKDSDTDDHISKADSKAVITDTVTFANLIEGLEYEVTGTLMDKATGKAVKVNGKEIKASKKFTADKADSSIDLEFTFDASSLKGKTLVVFESITYEGKEVADHKDINDADQSIFFPEIKTNAKDSDTNAHISNADNMATIVDTVTYSNLVPGKEYTLTGTLMNRANGKELLVDGEKVTETITFTPSKANGSISLEFTFDASALKGKSAVVFESLALGETEIAEHKDIKDEKQTVAFPEVKTSASKSGDGKITDIVKYSNLIAGKTYKVSGVLMDKATGEALLIDGKKVTAAKTFKAEKTSGSVEVTFNFDQASLDGKKLVVFETLNLDGRIVGEHKDINDADQTVRITVPKEGKDDTKIEPESDSPKTGDDSHILLYIGMLLASLLTIALALFSMRRRNENCK